MSAGDYEAGFAACLLIMRQGKRAIVEAGARAHSQRLWREIDERAEGHPAWSYAAQEAEITAGTRFLRAAADAIEVEHREHTR